MPDLSPRLFRSSAAADSRRIVEQAKLLVHQSRTLVDEARRERAPFLAFINDVLATIAHSRTLLDRSARQLQASRHWTAWGYRDPRLDMSQDEDA